MSYQESFNIWKNKVKEKKIIDELNSMTEEEKEFAFFKDIEFGTAGMRGIVGAGTNCMNKYTVARVTEAIALFMKRNNKKSIAVSYDTRNMSLDFAKLVAKICSAHGIVVYLSNDFMPTPFLSYMVRFYHCDMGIMITASHNPKNYNGYKVYDETGCQLLEEPSKEIIKIANEIGLFKFKTKSLSSAINENLVRYTDERILNSYMADVVKMSKNKVENLKVVYSALNGTGIKTVPQVLISRGSNVILNKKQCKADKNFTTCPKPNPEYEEVYSSSKLIAKRINADLILASDPDADRVGVCVYSNGEYIHLTGNEIGVLLSEYLFSKSNGGILVKSIVSTPLAQKIASKYAAKTKNVLTGFKYIGEFISKLEKDNIENQFVLGFEESSGYLSGTYVRDKDATNACMLICEMASELKKQGKTLCDKLDEIYNEFGYYQAKLFSYRFEGTVGFEKMQEILAKIRNNNPNKFGDLKVVCVSDYLDGIDDLPKANVILFELEGGATIVVRPSGTEPIIKNYVSMNKTKEENEINFEKIKITLDEIFK